MRISDWSSDVCSSDLTRRKRRDMDVRRRTSIAWQSKPRLLGWTEVLNLSGPPFRRKSRFSGNTHVCEARARREPPIPKMQQAQDGLQKRAFTLTLRLSDRKSKRLNSSH